MSYIADIKAKFETLYPDGTFLFMSEVRADDNARNIDEFPLFVIDDKPLNTTITIEEDAGAKDVPALVIYVLTKKDTSGNQIDESISNRFDQHEECVVPMKDVALRVMGQYFRTGDNVLRTRGVKPTFNIRDEYNLWSKMLYGISMRVSNLTIRRVINYCDNFKTDNFKSTDVLGKDIDLNFVPDFTETITE